MKKIYLSLIFAIVSISLFAQEADKKDEKKKKATLITSCSYWCKDTLYTKRKGENQKKRSARRMLQLGVG